MIVVVDVAEAIRDAIVPVEHVDIERDDDALLVAPLVFVNADAAEQLEGLDEHTAHAVSGHVHRRASIRHPTAATSAKTSGLAVSTATRTTSCRSEIRCRIVWASVSCSSKCRPSARR